MSPWIAILWLFATCPWVVVSLHNICYIKSKVLKRRQCSLCLTDSFLLENLRYIRWIYSMRHSHSVFICIYVTKEEKNLNLVDKFTNSISICVLNICISKKTSDGKNKSHRIQFDAQPNMLRFHLHPCECRIFYPSFSSVWVVFSEYYMCFSLESLSNSRDTSVSPYWFVWNWFPSTLFQWNFWLMN